MPHNARPVHEVKASLFRVLGHPARVRILELLRDGERSVGALQAELGLDSSGTSQHLAALRRIGVRGRRGGRGRASTTASTTSASSTCSRPAATIIARRLATQQALLRRARAGVTTALLVAGLGAIGLGARSWPPRRAQLRRAGSRVQAAGAARCRRRRVLACSRAGRPLGAGFTNEFALRLGVDGLSGFFLATLGVVARRRSSSRCATSSPTAARPDASRVLTGAFVLALAALFCARDPLDVPRRLGADDAPARGDDPRRARRRPERRGGRVFAYLALTHLGGAGTWVAVLLLAQAGALGGSAAIAPGSGLQVAIALAALVGMGTKAGLMPLHVLAAARASDRARAGVGADERRDDQGRRSTASCACSSSGSASCRCGSACSCSALGALSAVGGVVYALFQHDLKRLLALHSIENVGIIVLGLGACLVLRARGSRHVGGVRARRRAAAHAQPCRLQGAALPRRRRVRARGRLAASSTGSAACCAACRGRAARSSSARWRSPGLPPLNGFASEWLTLQALLHVPAVRPRRRRDRGRDRARRARGDGGARRASASSRWSGSCSSGRRGGRRPRPRSRRRSPMRAGVVASSPSAASCSASRRGCSSGRSSGSRPGRRPRRPGSGSTCPGPARCRRVGIARRARSRSRRCSARAARPP